MLGKLILVNADVREWEWDGEPFHAFLCDPPYEIAFAGNRWDSTGVAFQQETWERFFAALHPGAFGCTFAGAQMQSWVGIANAILGAGFVPHPTFSMISWINATGWSKGTNVSVAIDKAAGAEREKDARGYVAPDGKRHLHRKVERSTVYGKTRKASRTLPATPLAAEFDGYYYGGQVLRPCTEPALLFQRPYVGKPLDCITTTGAGALNVAGCRIGHAGEQKETKRSPRKGSTFSEASGGLRNEEHTSASDNSDGRFPSNVILIHLPGCRIVGTKRVKVDPQEERFGYAPTGTGTASGTIMTRRGTGNVDEDGFEEVEEWLCEEGCPVAALARQSGERGGSDGRQINAGDCTRFYFNAGWEWENTEPFKYSAKASIMERECGLHGKWPCVRCGGVDTVTHIERDEHTGEEYEVACRRNEHPTVKPISLTRYLATLLLPPRTYAPRRILIPFAGVGSEVIGALLAGWEEVVAIEQDATYCEILTARVEWFRANPEPPRRPHVDRTSREGGMGNLF